LTEIDFWVLGGFGTGVGPFGETLSYGGFA